MNIKKTFGSLALTVTGTVVSINRETWPLSGMEPGFSAVVRNLAGREVTEQVGPAWFTSFYREKWNITEGDTVTGRPAG